LRNQAKKELMTTYARSDVSSEVYFLRKAEYLVHFFRDTTKRRSEQDRERLLHEVGERVKELNCLYGLTSLAETPGISLDEILKGSPDLISRAYQYPDITCSRIVLEGKEFQTSNFKETPWKQYADIKLNGQKIGAIDIYYLQEKPTIDEGPFLKEERRLIDAVAERLARITERKKAEEALRESEERFRTIFEGAAEGIAVANVKTESLVFANSAMCELTGYSLKELISLSVGDIHSREDLPYVLGEFEKLAERKANIASDIPVLRKDGQVVYCDVTSKSYCFGKEECLVGFFRDITERKKAEEALRESEERFRTIFEGATDGILGANIETQRLVFANPQMCQMMGYSLEELLKRGVADIIHPKESLPYVVDMFDMFTKQLTGEIILSKDMPILREDKQIIYCDISSRPLEIGKQPCLVGFFRDVTERKKAEKKLVESNSALEKRLSEITILQKELETTNQLLGQSNVDLENYTYVVSHDLKAPLRAIRSFSTFLLEDYSGKLDAKGQDYLRRIVDASSRMDTLIENLLLLSRVGRKFMEVEIVDLNQLLEEIVADLEPSIQKNNGKVIFHNFPAVSVQRTWMKELFMNLIDNGLKFNKSKTPRVEVTYEEKEPGLLFKVHDNGIGIEEKYFDQLFTLFKRLHTQEEYEGTGAGLAICKKIVQQFGGRIWVESQVRRGSTFFFTLPKKKNPTSGDK
jgi:PAS domain S-box-containing protein